VTVPLSTFAALHQIASAYISVNCCSMAEVAYGPKTLFQAMLQVLVKVQKILYQISKVHEGHQIEYKQFFEVFSTSGAGTLLLEQYLRDNKMTNVTSNTLMRLGEGVMWHVVTPHEVDYPETIINDKFVRRKRIKTPGVWRVKLSTRQTKAEQKQAEDRAAAVAKAAAQRKDFLDKLKQEVPAPGCPLKEGQAMRRMEIRVCDPSQELSVGELYNTKEFEGISLEHYADTLNGNREAFARIIIRLVEGILQRAFLYRTLFKQT
jgi:hypothetical protein